MLEECQDVSEYWQGVDKLLQRWLDERQALLSAYSSLSDAIMDTSNHEQSITKIRTFCQILMDYISVGHFEIYEQLVTEGRIFADNNAVLTNELYPIIANNTEAALAFNDTYDTDQHCEIALSKLPTVLAQLGLSLKERFALEDKLIQAMHSAHRNLIS